MKKSFEMMKFEYFDKQFELNERRINILDIKLNRLLELLDKPIEIRRIKK